ncbi:MAG: proprotein convertase P-domain-containing protein [Verrucomicrobiales bacterium]|nr:proprotein convertase P-domain-containing protein [Verrucomicrobiales bacterium]
MKNTFHLLAVSAAVMVTTAPAAVIETYPFAVGLAVPDGNPSGLANVQNISGTIDTITSLKVSLNVTTQFNGDLYAYVTHGSGFSVLLNRTGVINNGEFGYNDDGFNVTFSDLATHDVHLYNDFIAPLAPTTALTGEWQPDGRLIDPDLVESGSPRTSPTLNSFNGLDPDGDWTLFVADLVTGDPATLNSWSLEITGTVIPEPSRALMLGVGLLSLALRRRRR